jgi:hypothetical protein
MEDFFDNFLYIIITIAVLAFSMLNKKKKSEEAQRRTTETAGERPGSVFDPFEEILGAEEELYEDDEEQEELKPIPSIFSNPMHSGKPSNEAFNPEVTSAFNQEAAKKPVSGDQPSGVEDGMIIDMKYDWDKEAEKPVTIDFDLRTAVIQAEILNKKYS